MKIMTPAQLFRFTPCSFLTFLWLLSAPLTGDAQSSSLVWLNGGSLSYSPFAMEGQTNAVNIIPDYSHAGYMGGGVAIPAVPVAITLSPSGEDDTGMIQEAIDEVEAMAPDANGFRGAVLLQAGCYEIEGQLYIEQSGVVLRGEGQGYDGTGTILHANLQAQHDFITIQGTGSGFDRPSSSRQDITTPYVPLGAYSFEIADASGHAVGDTIVLRRTPNQFWIDDIGMDEIGWTPSSYAIFHERVIMEIAGNTLTINLPIVDVIEEQYGGGEIYKASVPGRIKQCGVENLRIQSYYAPNDPTDEDHAWIGVLLQRVTDSWVKNVTGQFLGYGTVTIRGESNFNTIQDCASIDPRSQISGGKRYSFNISDGLGNLFQRNYTHQGRHDFVTGSRVTGPNVFLDNYSTEVYSDIGPHHRWATGLLFDNVRGGAIRVQNRGTSGSGHGWAGNTTMFWNLLSYTSEIKVESPKGGKNWGMGCRGLQQSGAGHWEHWNTAIQPRSLYLQQLQDRLGAEAVENITIPEQLTGDIYALLENWAGGGGFEQPDFDAALYVSEDAYVRGGGDADTNFGSATQLAVKNNGEGHGNTRRSFIKFDLSSLSAPIYDVRLRLNVSNDAPNPTQDVLYLVPDDSWSEMAITYNNQPAVGSMVGIQPVPPNGAWVEYDITTLVNDEMAGDGILSFRLSAEAEGANLHAYSAREESGLAAEPHLAYNFTPGGTPDFDPCTVLPTSVESAENDAAGPQPSFTLSPNPVREVLRIDFVHTPAAEVYVFKITGQLVRTLRKARGASSLQVPVADLPGGLYLIRVGAETQRLLKL
ncbi:MAG: DNRLRE domain-containing protein [Phaeodactylibacter sp.]|uniref:CBM96 family carbohydrate-binding protein n=1 Tax=Phaeodactylibacter sp. TaxID=1940289 RepID=UPI0032EBC2FE